MNHHDSWGPGSWNPPDHRAVGRAALDAAADAGNRWIFSEVDGLEPYARTFLEQMATDAGTHFVTFELITY